jgi:hypothetical protein
MGPHHLPGKNREQCERVAKELTGILFKNSSTGLTLGTIVGTQVYDEENGYSIWGEIEPNNDRAFEMLQRPDIFKFSMGVKTMTATTVNEAMVKMKAVRERLNGLKALRAKVAIEERWMERDKVNVPQYDVSFVDRKITELQLWLMEVDSAIKISNAQTTIMIDADVEKLLEPIPSKTEGDENVQD